MVASAIYIMDPKGKIIISRDYRGDIPLSATVKFNQRLQESDEADVKPVFSIDGVTYVFVRESNLLLLAVAKKNSNITVILLFLSHILRVMTDYFGEVTEETIRDNFVITYELLDEMMDYGYVRRRRCLLRFGVGVCCWVAWMFGRCWFGQLADLAVSLLLCATPGTHRARKARFSRSTSPSRPIALRNSWPLRQL